MNFSTVLSFVLVGACWGCTTPFIKNGTSDAAKGEPASSSGDQNNVKGRVEKLLGPLRSLASIKAAVPFLLNQSGSGLYYYLLGSQDISTAVPVCNSLTFLFTAATAMWLGEEIDRPLHKVAGMLLVLVGIAVCVASKAGQPVPQND
ncbi:unnamed protein product [Ascophyllum nodosum]